MIYLPVTGDKAMFHQQHTSNRWQLNNWQLVMA